MCLARGAAVTCPREPIAGLPAGCSAVGRVQGVTSITVTSPITRWCARSTLPVLSGSECAQSVAVAPINVAPRSSLETCNGERGQLCSLSDFQTGSFLVTNKRRW